MASAGRILIMPKGNYDASNTYEMLDLVYYNGTSWIAKQTTIGIEPNTTNDAYWHKLCDSSDVAEIERRLQALENDEVDLSDYLSLSGGTLRGQLGVGGGKAVINGNDYGAYLQAQKDSANYRKLRVDNPSQTSDIANWMKLVDCVNGTETSYKIFGEHNKDFLLSLISASVSGVKFYAGTHNRANADNVVTFSCTFPPKLIIVLGKSTSNAAYYSITVIIPEKTTGITFVQAGSMSMAGVTVTTSGNDVTISHTENVNMAPYYACNSASMTYPYICIG